MRVLDFAIEMERSGRDFYRRLSREAEEVGMRNLYAAMAQDEENILTKLREMVEEFPPVESRVLEEMAQPVLFWGGIFPDTSAEAYRHLMEMERGLLRFYEEAAQRETNPAARDQLLRVAAEEERELRDLEATFDFVNAPNEYLAWREFSNLDDFHNFGRYEDNRRCGHTS